MSAKNGKVRKCKSAAKDAPPPDEPEDDGEDTQKESEAAALAGRAQELYEPWHNDRKEPFATARGGPPVTYPLSDPEFARMLVRDAFLRSEGKHVPSAVTVKGAVNLLEAIAGEDGPCREDRLRVGAAGDNHFLSLADRKWRA